MINYTASNGWRSSTNAAIIERASFREEAGPAWRMRYRGVTALTGRTGSGSSFSYMDIPKHEGIRAVKSLPDNVELTLGKSVPVWGLMAGEGAGNLDGTESFEDMAKRVT